VSTSSCRFPSWAHGQWQDAYVEDDTLIYKDLRNFKTYTLKCMVDDKTLPDDQGKFVVYARTQWLISIDFLFLSISILKLIFLLFLLCLW
jgi:hypothetical protein